MLFNAVDIAHRGLNYHLRRHNVLASNVANIDTPGFRPMELIRETEGTQRGLRTERTQPGHLRSHAGGDETFSEARERVVQPGSDGNAVSLEREMAKVAANDLRYEAIGRMVRAHLGALRYAATDGQG
ncbi:MAG: flagellar basal body rod protein FlgB [Myxococcota bacterium]